MMSKVMARVLSTVLALLLMLLPLASLAEEAAGGDLFSIQISNISLEIEGMDEPLTFLPALTMAAGLDEAGERGVMQLLLTVQEATAANIVLAYEDGLVKAYVENMPSYIEIPVEQLEAMAAEAMAAMAAEGEIDLASLLSAFEPYITYSEKFSDPEYVLDFSQRVKAAYEEQYADWYKGEIEVEQDGVKATVKEYEISFGSMEEIGAYVDFFVGLDESMGAMVKPLLDSLSESLGTEAESFTELYAQIGELAEISMTGTMYYNEEGTVAGLDMQATASEVQGDGLFTMTMSEKITQIDEQNAHVAVAMDITVPEDPESNVMSFALDVLLTDDGEAQASEVSASFAVLEDGEQTSMTFASSSGQDASKSGFAGTIGILADGMTIELSMSFDGDWYESAGVKVYSGPFQIALGGDMGSYALSASVVAATQPLPAGAMLTTGVAGVNPLEMDEEALDNLAAEFQTAMFSALGVLMQDPTLASMFADTMAE